MKREITGFILCLTLAACGTQATLPTPNNAKTAGTEALVAYGLTAHVENQYLALPLCTKPLTTVPCKTQAVVDKMKAADLVAYNAAVAVDNAANPAAATDKAKQANLEFQAAVEAGNGGKQ
jgi:hypothetical protein